MSDQQKVISGVATHHLLDILSMPTVDSYDFQDGYNDYKRCDAHRGSLTHEEHYWCDQLTTCLTKARARLSVKDPELKGKLLSLPIQRF